MKLQLQDSVARFRVSHAELGLLRNSGTLAVDVPWPGQPWRLDVTMGPELLLSSEPEGVLLTLPADDLTDLASRLPAREGLVYRLKSGDAALELRFEVDIHAGRRRAR